MNSFKALWYHSFDALEERKNKNNKDNVYFLDAPNPSPPPPLKHELTTYKNPDGASNRLP